ncbi:hypothetical protein [Streptomyces sp. NPDC058548]|uniref:hypothetical protein n=1 Tax=unclassified Streptomyces TaxID=2593676 RepID=UPI0036655162
MPDPHPKGPLPVSKPITPPPQQRQVQQEAQQPAVNAVAQGEAVAALHKVIAALSASDPQTFYTSADTFEQAATKLTELSTAMKARAKQLFGDGSGEGWQGEGARACSRIVDQFIKYLDDSIPYVRNWPEHTRASGEALQQAWYDVDAILAKYAGQTPAAAGAQPAAKSV